MHLRTVVVVAALVLVGVGPALARAYTPHRAVSRAYTVGAEPSPGETEGVKKRAEEAAKEQQRENEEKRRKEEELAAKPLREQHEAEERKAREAREAKEAFEREAEHGSQNQMVHCVVPSLSGDSLAKARRALQRSHCRLGHAALPVGHHRGPLVVRSEQPRAGSQLAEGATVTIVLGPRAVHRHR